MVPTGSKLDKSINVMLVAIGVMFLLTVVPKKVFYVGLEYGVWFDYKAFSNYWYYALLQFVVNILDL